MNRYAYWGVVFVSVLWVAGCSETSPPPAAHGDHGQHDHDAAHMEHDTGHAHQSAHDDHGDHDGHAEEVISMTQWGMSVEVLLEYAPLVVQEPATFLIRLTRLDDFAPVTAGEVTLRLTNVEGKVWTFVAAQPLHPGIFQPMVHVPVAGEYQLQLAITGPQVTDELDVGMVHVYGSARAAAMDHGQPHSDAGEIAYVKEQQWLGDFLVEAARQRSLTPTIRALGQVRAPLEAATKLTATGSGTIQTPPDGIPLLGAAVEAGQTMALLQQSGVEQVVPVIAPVNGVVAVAHVRAGDVVEAGWTLFELMDLSTIWVAVDVYEPDVPHVQTTREAMIQVPGTDQYVTSTRRVSVGGAIDQAARTLPVVFAIDNAAGLFRVGTSVSAELQAGDPSEMLAIPHTALVDMNGTWVVYVQVTGESFTQRTVQLGLRQGPWVAITAGLLPGERVVTRGAYQVRLAASSTELPAHGHAH